jgi:uncharacterized membrane protein YphA (DoxX/SURF4 family)
MSSNVPVNLATGVLRVAVGAVFIAHGSQKLFGWFGGGGIAGVGRGMHMMGFRPGERHATVAGLIETGGGAALALGLATPAAGASTAIAMGVAAGAQASNGFFASKQGSNTRRCSASQRHHSHSAAPDVSPSTLPPGDSWTRGGCVRLASSLYRS